MWTEDALVRRSKPEGQKTSDRFNESLRLYRLGDVAIETSGKNAVAIPHHG
jgi:hypothetical protein